MIQIYAAQGFERFLLATGYLGEAVEEFVAAQRWPEGVEVECVDTGLDTPTGGRIAKLGNRLAPRPSALPMPTASPTSTSARCSSSTAATAAWRR